MARRGRHSSRSEPLPADLKPAAFNEWVPVFRRVIADPSIKCVGMMAASYASPDGTNIFPGNVRIVNVTGLSDRAVRNAFRVLRDLGLMHRCAKGSACGRRGMADEYRLTIPLDIFGRTEMLTPDEELPDPGTPVLSACDQPGTAAATAGDPCG